MESMIKARNILCIKTLSSIDLDVCENEIKPAYYGMSLLGPVGKGY